jgi:hypothetical protein
MSRDLNLQLMPLILALTLLISCSAVRTPIQTVPAKSRQTIEAVEGQAVAVRLTEATNVAGISVPAGSIMRQTSDTQCSVFPAEAVLIGNIQIPAASEIELVLSGGVYAWNGMVKIGDTTTYSELNLVAGDVIYFVGDLAVQPILAQIRLGSHREFAGQWYPAETVIHLDANRKVVQISPSLPPDVLATQQESYWKQKAEHESRCVEICANHKKNSPAHKSCMEYCMNR